MKEGGTEGPAEGAGSAEFPDRRIPIQYAVLFYGLLAAAAWMLLHLRDAEASRRLWTPENPPLAFGAGAGLALLMVLGRGIALRVSGRARAMEAEFGRFLGRQPKGECLLLAVVSGAAEEYFFRGWMQDAAGIWIATAVFAVLHWPLNRNLLPWPALALGAGLVLGGVTVWTGNLVAAATAHAVYNAVALWRITDRFGGGAPGTADRKMETGRQA